MQANLRRARISGRVIPADAVEIVDENWYLQLYPDVEAAGLSGSEHYFATGWAEGRNPHPIFDTEWYFSEYPDVEQSGINPLCHYVETGWKEGRNPHPLFDTSYYLSGNKDVASAGLNPLLHYLRHGWREKRRPHPLFDNTWYREKYPDTTDTDPLASYICQGWAEHRWPNPLFDPAWYVKNNPSAAQAPLAHFVRNGLDQKLNPHPLFDTAFYLNRYPDVAQAGINPLAHYLSRGHAELRDPNPKFDTAWYLRTFPNAADHLPLIHYIQSGAQGPTRPDEKPTRPKVSLTEGLCAVEPTYPDILLVAHSVPKDGRLFGAERSFLDMAKAISRFGCNLNIALPNGNPDYIKALSPLCARIFILPYPWWRAGQEINEAVVKDFRDIIRQTGAKLVYTNTIMLREPLIAARAEKVSTAVHCREMISGDPQLTALIGEPPEQIAKKVRDAADLVVANSKIIASLFMQGGDGIIAPNVVYPDQFKSYPPTDSEVVRVGIVSSNIRKKGIEDFAEIAELCSENPKLQFHIIGPETDVVRELKTRMNDSRAKDNLHFDGYAESPVKAIGGIDVLLCLSHFAESFGRTVAEAMAAGKLVIAYDHGAVPELIRHGETGFLTSKGDKVAVARKLLEYAAAPSAFKNISDQARKFITDHHSPPALETAYEPLFARYSVKRRESPPAQTAKTMSPLSVKDRDARLKIAYFCWHFPVPSETFVLNELRVLHEEGHELHVFCRQTPYPDFKPDFPITYTRVTSPEVLAEHLKQFRADIVHGHFVYPTITDMVWPAAELAQIPFTFIAHAQDIFRYSNDAKNRIDEIANSPLCRKVFTLSRFHRQFLADRGVPQNKLAISPNAVDPELFKGLTPRGSGRRSICTVARFVEKKGIEHLIRAAPLLAEHGIDVHIYGYGELEETYRKTATELNAENVYLHGPVSSREELVQTFSRHDLCICPSVRTADGDMDGIPTVLLEAMAAGLPVMATEVAGIPDLVIDGVTGFICEPTPSGIREAVRNFYNLPEGMIRRITEAAHEHLQMNHNVRRIVNNMVRVWKNQTLTVVLVTWNNLPELKEVLRRLLHFTSLPFEVSICDNNSEEDVKAYLRSVAAHHSNVRVYFNPDNAMVGPGTNIAMENANSDYVIYLCGKEGFALDYNWENAFVYTLDENPNAAMAGTLCYSPSYLTGKDFPTGNSLFKDYRGQEFCLNNPDKEFLHIQGGLFAMRSSAVKASGGFSNKVPHNGTDIEFSVYMESLGWELARAKGMVSLYNKTRPSLEARLDESTRIAHPPTLLDLDWIDAVVSRKLHLCTVCGWKGKNFTGGMGHHTCPQCGCSGDDRTLWRFLATETTLTYRRLPALGVGLSGEMLKVWQQQFQGPTFSHEDLIRVLSKSGSLPNRQGGLELITLVDFAKLSAPDQSILLREFARLLKPGSGKFLLIDAPPEQTQMSKFGFTHLRSKGYSSYACRFGWRSVHEYELR